MPKPLFDMSKAQPIQADKPLFDMSQAQPIDAQGYTPQPGDATMGADNRGAATSWLDDLDHDLRQGGNRTVVGRALGRAQGRDDKGFSGMETGGTASQADFVGSVPLGVVKYAQGMVDTYGNGHPVQGALKSLGGLLQATQVPLAMVGAPEAADAASEVGSAVKSGAGKMASKVKEPFSLDKVQQAKDFNLDEIKKTLSTASDSIHKEMLGNLDSIREKWHGNVRSLLDDTAKEAGVTVKPSASLHDTANNVAAALKQKASGLYKQLDDALGGTKFQTFDQQLNNVKKTLRMSAGIDPEKDGVLVERINALEQAKQNAIGELLQKGVDPSIINEANQAYKQGSALEDLGTHMRVSISGLRSNLAQGVDAAAESLSPAKLSKRATAMYNNGRLQQALGPERADELLRHAETSVAEGKKAAQSAVDKTEAAKATASDAAEKVKDEASAAADKVKRNKRIVTGGLTLLGLGALGHHVIP